MLSLVFRTMVTESLSLLAPNPFDAIAPEYDRIFTESLIGRAQRSFVWKVAEQSFRAGQKILELNCGTGVDALFLAGLGCHVVALDGSFTMVEVAKKRIQEGNRQSQIEVRRLTIEQLASFQSESPYDGVFSNFGGLNCIGDCSALQCSLARLVKPGGKMILCLMNPNCIWEIGFFVSQCQFRKAIRRWQRLGVSARIGGQEIQVFYPSVRSLTEALSPAFTYLDHRAVGLVVPPSYFESWARNHPRALKLARLLDKRIASWPGFRNLGDHYVVQFERRS